MSISAPLEPQRRAPYIGCMAQSLTLTEAAANRVNAIAHKQGRPAILRLSVEGGGCSGFQYKFDLTDRADTDDAVSETAGVKLVIDPIESLGGAAFKVENPNAAAGCGCGSSFGI